MSTIRPKKHRLAESGAWCSPSINPAAPSPERLLWLGFDRATTITDARWARQSAGIDVQVVRTIEHAIAACDKAVPLAVVVEFELEDGDGVQALECLREHGVRVPAVLISPTPDLAIARLDVSRLTETIPVFGRAERYDRLREWLDQLRMCLAMLA
jgi:hypothetical protein